MSTIALALPFLAVAVALARARLVWGVFVFFVYLSVEGMIKLAGNYHPVVHIGVDIVLWGILGAWVAKAIIARRTRVLRVPLLTVLVLHVTWVSLLVFSPYTASIFVGVASLKIHLSMIPLYFLGFLLASDSDVPRQFIRFMTIVWCTAFAITLLQYLGGPGSLLDFSGPALARFSYFLEWRPFGTTALPGGEAVFALMALPFAFYLMLRGDYRLRDPLILTTVIGSLAVFFISGGRQVFLGSLIIIIGMVALQVIRGRGRAISGAILVATLTATTYIGVREYLLPAAQVSLEDATGIPDIWRERNPIDRFQSLLQRDTYVSARRGGFAVVWDRIRSAPFGVGLGRTGSASSALGGSLTQDQFNAQLQRRFSFQDNFFAAMIVETGIPGVLFMTIILIGLGIRAVRLSRRAHTVEDSAFGSLVAGYMLAMFVMCWGSQPLLANPTIAFFWFLGGMASRRLQETEDTTTASLPDTQQSRAAEF
jgi:ABC-type multidrug transport system fused ATPase/permease subunit